MWKAVMGRGDKPEDTTSKRKEDSKSKDDSRPKRRDSGKEPDNRDTDRRDSDLATSSSRKASRGDDRGINPVSTSYSSSSKSPYPGGAAASIASSYQTAQPNSAGDVNYPDLVRNSSMMEDLPRGARAADEDKKSRRRERSSSRDRKGHRRDRSRSEERVKSEKKDKKLKRRSTDASLYSGETSRAIEDTSTRTDRPGISNHVPDMFPGQFPSGASAPYRPPNSASQGRPGLASEYYNDGGASVFNQPGIRPSSPDVIVGSEPHLMTPLASGAPPPEPSALGQVGAAASFYGGDPNAGSNTASSARPTSSNQYSSHSTQRPTGSSGALPAIGAAAAAVAAGYMMNSHSEQSTHQSSYQGRPPSNTYAQDPTYADFHPQRPGKQSFPSNIPYAAAAAGAAGLAAGAYYSNGHNHPGPYQGSSGNGGGYNTGMTHQHRHVGPLDKIVNFFKDPEGVARFEEYSEAIGICRGCFEPGTNPRQAPRKHNYRPRRSREDLRSSRVDKDNRYYVSSDGDGRRRSKKSLIGAAAATIGLASVGRTLAGDFDDTYSVKSGKQPVGSSGRRSSGDYRRDSYEYRDKKTSRKSDKKVEYGITSSGGIYKKDQAGKDSTERILVEHSRSRSGSRNGKSLRNAAIGAAAGAAITAAATRRKSGDEIIRVKHRSRSRSSERRSRRRQSPVQSPGLFGSFFSTPSSNRPRKSKGFFNFSNGSSSSDSSGTFGTSERERRRVKTKRSSPRIKTAAEANAALIGLGTAAAALAAHESRGRSSGKHAPAVVAVKTRPNQKHRSRTNRADADDDWESADESDSSADSALAFGSPFSRSRESLAETGTDKWDWRWGQKKRRFSNSKDDAQRLNSGYKAAAVAGLAGAAGFALIGGAAAGRDSKHGYEASSGQQYYRSRSDSIPIQQPQPFVPVPEAVYASGVQSRIPVEDQNNRDSMGSVGILSKSPRTKDEGVRFDFTREQQDKHRGDGYHQVKRSLQEIEEEEAEFERRSREAQRARKARETLEKDRLTRDRLMGISDPAQSDLMPLKKDDAVEVLIEPGRAPQILHIPSDHLDSLKAELAAMKAALPAKSKANGKTGAAALGLAGIAAAAVASEAKMRQKAEASQDPNDPKSKKSRSKSGGGFADLVAAARKSKDQDKPNKEKSTKEESRQVEADDITREIASRAATKVKISRSTTPVTHESYAAYFAPDILSKPATTKETNPDPNADVKFTRTRARTGSLGDPFIPPAYKEIEGEEFDPPEMHRYLPWQVPHLGLTNPTPIPSAQPSPMIQAVETPVTEERQQKDRSTKPRSGENGEAAYTTIEPRGSPEEDTAIREERKKSKKRDSKRRSSQPIQAESLTEEIPRETVPGTMPGGFEDDIDFAATLAAGTAAAGFDPEIVINDPTYRRRDSPPGSQTSTFYRQPYAQTVSDIGLTNGSRQRQQGFIEGEVPDTPKEEQNQIIEEPEPEIKLTKKEQRKKEKAAKRQSRDDNVLDDASFAETPQEKDKTRIRDSATMEIIEDMARDTQTEPDTPGTTKSKKKSKRSETSDFAALAFAAAGGAAAAGVANKFSETSSNVEEKKPKRGGGGFDFGTLAMAAAQEASESRQKDVSRFEPRDVNNQSESQHGYSKNDLEDASNTPLPRGDSENSGPSSSFSKTMSEPKDAEEAFESPSEYAASAYTVPTGDEDDGESRKHRKKSKRRSKTFDDTASVVTLPARLDDEKDFSKIKEKKGGIFGLFSKVSSNDSNEKRRSKEIPAEVAEQFEEPKKKKKSRKSRDGGDDFYSIASTSVADISKLDEDEDDRKSRRRRSRRGTQDEEELGRSTQDLQSENDYDTANETDKQARRESFLGERREKPKPPDIDTRYYDSGGVDPGSSRRSSSSPPLSRPSTPPKIDWIKDDQYTLGEVRSRALSMVTGSTNFQPATPSPTAIPLVFRKPPSAGGVKSSPTAVSPSLGAPKSRRNRPSSVEFRTNEFRPLWLVTQYQPKQEFDPEELLPSLPSSHSNSRTSSVHEDDVPTIEFPRSKFKGKDIDVAATRDLQAEVLDSEQTTPTAASYRAKREQDLLDEARQEAVARELEWTTKNSPESKRRSQETPTKKSPFGRDMLQDAGMVALAGGAAAMAFSALHDDSKQTDSKAAIGAIDTSLRDFDRRKAPSDDELDAKTVSKEAPLPVSASKFSTESTSPDEPMVIEASPEHEIESKTPTKLRKGSKKDKTRQSTEKVPDPDYEVTKDIFQGQTESSTSPNHQDFETMKESNTNDSMPFERKSEAEDYANRSEVNNDADLKQVPESLSPTVVPSNKELLYNDKKHTEPQEEDWAVSVTPSKKGKKKSQSVDDTLSSMTNTIQPANESESTVPLDSAARSSDTAVDVEGDAWDFKPTKKSKKGKNRKQNSLSEPKNSQVEREVVPEIIHQNDDPKALKDVQSMVPSYEADAPVEMDPETTAAELNSRVADNAEAEDEWNFGKKTKKKGKKAKATAAALMAAAVVKSESPEPAHDSSSQASEQHIIESQAEDSHTKVADDEWASSWTNKKAKKKKGKQSAQSSDESPIDRRPLPIDAPFEDFEDGGGDTSSSRGKKQKKRKSVTFLEDPVASNHQIPVYLSADESEAQQAYNEAARTDRSSLNNAELLSSNNSTTLFDEPMSAEPLELTDEQDNDADVFVDAENMQPVLGHDELSDVTSVDQTERESSNLHDDDEPEDDLQEFVDVPELSSQTSAIDRASVEDQVPASVNQGPDAESIALPESPTGIEDDYLTKEASEIVPDLADNDSISSKKNSKGNKGKQSKRTEDDSSSETPAAQQHPQTITSEEQLRNDLLSATLTAVTASAAAVMVGADKSEDIFEPTFTRNKKKDKKKKKRSALEWNDESESTSIVTDEAINDQHVGPSSAAQVTQIGRNDKQLQIIDDMIPDEPMVQTMAAESNEEAFSDAQSSGQRQLRSINTTDIPSSGLEQNTDLVTDVPTVQPTEEDTFGEISSKEKKKSKKNKKFSAWDDGSEDLNTIESSNADAEVPEETPESKVVITPPEIIKEDLPYADLPTDNIEEDEWAVPSKKKKKSKKSKSSSWNEESVSVAEPGHSLAPQVSSAGTSYTDPVVDEELSSSIPVEDEASQLAIRTTEVDTANTVDQFDWAPVSKKDQKKKRKSSNWNNDDLNSNVQNESQIESASMVQDSNELQPLVDDKGKLDQSASHNAIQQELATDNGESSSIMHTSFEDTMLALATEPSELSQQISSADSAMPMVDAEQNDWAPSSKKNKKEDKKKRQSSTWDDMPAEDRDAMPEGSHVVEVDRDTAADTLSSTTGQKQSDSASVAEQSTFQTMENLEDVNQEQTSIVDDEWDYTPKKSKKKSKKQHLAWTEEAEKAAPSSQTLSEEFSAEPLLEAEPVTRQIPLETNNERHEESPIENRVMAVGSGATAATASTQKGSEELHPTGKKTKKKDKKKAKFTAWDDEPSQPEDNIISSEQSIEDSQPDAEIVPQSETLGHSTHLEQTTPDPSHVVASQINDRETSFDNQSVMDDDTWARPKKSKKGKKKQSISWEPEREEDTVFDTKSASMTASESIPTTSRELNDTTHNDTFIEGLTAPADEDSWAVPVKKSKKGKKQAATSWDSEPKPRSIQDQSKAVESDMAPDQPLIAGESPTVVDKDITVIEEPIPASEATEDIWKPSIRKSKKGKKKQMTEWEPETEPDSTDKSQDIRDPTTSNVVADSRLDPGITGTIEEASIMAEEDTWTMPVKKSKKGKSKVTELEPENEQESIEDGEVVTDQPDIDLVANTEIEAGNSGAAEDSSSILNDNFGIPNKSKKGKGKKIRSSNAWEVDEASRTEATDSAEPGASTEFHRESSPVTIQQPEDIIPVNLGDTVRDTAQDDEDAWATSSKKKKKDKKKKKTFELLNFDEASESTAGVEEQVDADTLLEESTALHTKEPNNITNDQIVVVDPQNEVEDKTASSMKKSKKNRKKQSVSAWDSTEDPSTWYELGKVTESSIESISEPGFPDTRPGVSEAEEAYLESKLAGEETRLLHDSLTDNPEIAQSTNEDVASILMQSADVHNGALDANKDNGRDDDFAWSDSKDSKDSKKNEKDRKPAVLEVEPVLVRSSDLEIKESIESLAKDEQSLLPERERPPVADSLLANEHHRRGSQVEASETAIEPSSNTRDVMVDEADLDVWAPATKRSKKSKKSKDKSKSAIELKEPEHTQIANEDGEDQIASHDEQVARSRSSDYDKTTPKSQDIDESREVPEHNSRDYTQDAIPLALVGAAGVAASTTLIDTDNNDHKELTDDFEPAWEPKPKGKKGKKSRKSISNTNIVNDDDPVVEKETPLDDQDISQDIRSHDVASQDQVEMSAGDDTWDVPVKQKGKKGKKSITLGGAPDEEGIVPRQDDNPMEQHHGSRDIQPIELTTTDQLDATVAEDVWDIPVKRKGKKGKRNTDTTEVKGTGLDLTQVHDNRPLEISQPEERIIDESSNSKSLDLQEIAGDEWDIPVKKKGKKSKRAALVEFDEAHEVIDSNSMDNTPGLLPSTDYAVEVIESSTPGPELSRVVDEQESVTNEWAAPAKKKGKKTKRQFELYGAEGAHLSELETSQENQIATTKPEPQLLESYIEDKANSIDPTATGDDTHKPDDKWNMSSIRGKQSKKSKRKPILQQVDDEPSLHSSIRDVIEPESAAGDPWYETSRNVDGNEDNTLHNDILNEQHQSHVSAGDISVHRAVIDDDIPNTIVSEKASSIVDDVPSFPVSEKEDVWDVPVKKKSKKSKKGKAFAWEDDVPGESSLAHDGNKRDLQEVNESSLSKQESNLGKTAKSAGKVGATLAIFEGIQRTSSMLDDQPPKKSRKTSREVESQSGDPDKSDQAQGYDEPQEQMTTLAAFRDSAVQLDSPTLSSNRESIRDSGFQDGIHHGMDVSVEVDPRYDVQISSPINAHTSIHRMHEEPGLPEQSQPQLSPQRAYFDREPSPVDAMSRERSAVLFSSSPSSRIEASRESYQSIEAPQSPIHSKSIFGGSIGHSSDRDIHDLKSPPRTPTGFGTPSKPLTTITETSPDDVLHSKQSQNPSEVEGRSSRRSIHRLKTPNQDHPRRLGLISTDDLISRLSWPDVDEEQQSVNLERSVSRNRSKDRRLSSGSKSRPTLNLDNGRAQDRRSVSVESNDSISAIIKSSPAVATPPLRRIHSRSISSDLRSASKRSEVGLTTSDHAKPDLSRARNIDFEEEESVENIASSSTYDPLKDKGKGRLSKMTDVYEGYGDLSASGSPTRPTSVRRRQSLQILDLEGRLDQLVSENRLLLDAKNRAERSLEQSASDNQQHTQALQDAIQTRDQYLQQKDEELASLRQTLDSLQDEVARLEDTSRSITGGDGDWQQRYNEIANEHEAVKGQLAEQAEELEELHNKHSSLSGGMEAIVANEVRLALQHKDAELSQIRAELESAKEQVRSLQKEILAARRGDVDMVVRDEDFFEEQYAELCDKVAQWCLRYSKFNDFRISRRMNEVEQVISDRFDNAILDGTDPDIYLADRIKRRDVFTSVVMSLMWEYIFTRYLFGLDREQRSKLKSLERILSEVGPPASVNRWRATTLTMLSKRAGFEAQREQDTQAVVAEILRNLSAFLPPPANLQQQITESLQRVVSMAVDLSIEMRCQQAEYIMLPPLQPSYNLQGDLENKIYFNPVTMQVRAGGNADEEAVVRLVLFPIIVKQEQGNEQEIIYHAQVLIADDEDNENGGDRGMKGGRGTISAQANRSVQSFAPSEMPGGMI